jgi:hypothetical protein
VAVERFWVRLVLRAMLGVGLLLTSGVGRDQTAGAGVKGTVGLALLFLSLPPLAYAAYVRYYVRNRHGVSGPPATADRSDERQVPGDRL